MHCSLLFSIDKFKKSAYDLWNMVLEAQRKVRGNIFQAKFKWFKGLKTTFVW